MKGRQLTKEEASAMGKKGGAVRGEQRKQETVAKIEAREALRKKIEADMDALYSAWRDAAIGHFITVDGVSVYKKSPNAVAIKDMFERAFGKPTQPIGFENPLQIQSLDKKAEELIAKINEYEETSDEDMAGDVEECTVSEQEGVDLRIPPIEKPTPHIRKVLLSPRHKGGIRDTGGTP